MINYNNKSTTSDVNETKIRHKKCPLSWEILKEIPK
jgi:hypothetical protein